MGCSETNGAIARHSFGAMPPTPSYDRTLDEILVRMEDRSVAGAGKACKTGLIPANRKSAEILCQSGSMPRQGCPPMDRAATIAGFQRKHHPVAVSLIVFRTDRSLRMAAACERLSPRGGLA